MELIVKKDGDNFWDPLFGSRLIDLVLLITPLVITLAPVIFVRNIPDLVGLTTPEKSEAIVSTGVHIFDTAIFIGLIVTAVGLGLSAVAHDKYVRVDGWSKLFGFWGAICALPSFILDYLKSNNPLTFLTVTSNIVAVVAVYYILFIGAVIVLMIRRGIKLRP